MFGVVVDGAGSAYIIADAGVSFEASILLYGAGGVYLFAPDVVDHVDVFRGLALAAGVLLVGEGGGRGVVFAHMRALELLDGFELQRNWLLPPGGLAGEVLGTVEGAAGLEGLVDSHSPAQSA